MKLLICTQKVDKDDDILGFFHRWLVEFAKHYDHVTVVALSVGQYDLPKNVEVVSLGKESGGNRIRYVGKFIRYIVRFRHRYDRVFVHMNPEYVVLGGLLWRFWSKRVGLWYTHRSVDMKLRVAELLAHAIFTSSRSSFKLESGKLHVLGHGIDIQAFSCPEREKLFSKPLQIICVGRLMFIKNQRIVVEAMRILRDRNVPFLLTFIGPSGRTRADREYAESVRKKVSNHELGDVVSFAGSIPNEKMPARYCEADVAINMLPHGGLDKAVIEAMACGVIPLTSNRGFAEHFGPYVDALVVAEDDPNDLADKIEVLVAREDIADIRGRLRAEAEKKFAVDALVNKVALLL